MSAARPTATSAAERVASALALLGADAPADLRLRGDARLLDRPLLAVLCSAVVPPTVVIGMLDVARALRDLGIGTIGGFHSPLERESLGFLLRGGAPVVVCKPREVERLRLPGPWRTALDRSRLLLVSTTGTATRRPTRALAARRNRVVAALATALFVGHARPGGSLFPLVREALRWGRPVFCLPDAANADLRLLGARPLDAAVLTAALGPAGIGPAAAPETPADPGAIASDPVAGP
jgi:hypothetical protein